MSLHLEQEVWANAHETRDNVSLVSYAGCLALSPCSDFGAVYSWNVVAAGNREIVTKTPILGVQGRSRSSMLVAAESSSAVTVMISRESVSIWNRSHARLVDTSRRANSGKITIWCLRSRGISSPAARSLLTRNKRLCAIIWWKPGVSILPGLGLVPGCDGQTDGQTNRILIASTRLALRAVVRKKTKSQLLLQYMTIYSEYFELHFASIRSHNGWSDILTLWDLVKRPRWLKTRSTGAEIHGVQRKIYN